ncbi:MULTISPECIES: LysM peptidoglycan-binding domain-containing protein [Brevibacterium]|uniref:LysM peptidoglycan-binding domain-containing protein n=1 Tax=Brevibacterium casei TaxID=33889 RepID=A0A7T3ZWX6_9MICO|nr:LysM domain-containing protein [Brevibacterium casei]QQB13181.1 LysM peptidoglycan-binding domain-containing protein [Brevibacterium casei]
MYLIGLCAISWLSLLGGFASLWVALTQPWTVSDLVVLTLAGAAVLAFARLGLTALLALVTAVLPTGRLRTRLSAAAVRLAPRMLASSVLTAVAIGCAAQSALAVGGGSGPSLEVNAGPSLAGNAGPSPAAVPRVASVTDSSGVDSRPVTASDLPDPGWPTTPGAPLDPGWPTTDPADPPASPDPPNSTDPPDGASDTANDPDGETPDTDTRDPDAPAAPGPDSSTPTVHIVSRGESLWSIASELTDSDDARGTLVAAIHSANRDVIGADPDLIMPGQRLEIPS